MTFAKQCRDCLVSLSHVSDEQPEWMHTLDFMEDLRHSGLSPDVEFYSRLCCTCAFERFAEKHEHHLPVLFEMVSYNEARVWLTRSPARDMIGAWGAGLTFGELADLTALGLPVDELAEWDFSDPETRESDLLALKRWCVTMQRTAEHLPPSDIES